MEVPPLASEPNPVWSSFLLFYGYFLSFSRYSRYLRLFSSHPGYSPVHISMNLSIRSPYFGFLSWPGGVPHLRIRAQAGRLAESPCDGVGNGEAGVKRRQRLPFIILCPTDSIRHSWIPLSTLPSLEKVAPAFDCAERADIVIILPQPRFTRGTICPFELVYEHSALYLLFPITKVF